MPPRRLHNVLADCVRTLKYCQQFAADAHRWSQPGAHPHISRKRRDYITEVAFLRAYLAFESFLEEAFILYLLGQRPPRGRAPHRYTIPPNRQAADEWVVPEGRPYASWNTQYTMLRAQRFFRGGGHFKAPLQGSQAALEEAKTIRNAVAHESSSAQEKFERLVRNRLGTLPPGTSPGSFLATTVPGSTPPESFLDSYLSRIELVATQIVPT